MSRPVESMLCFSDLARVLSEIQLIEFDSPKFVAARDKTGFIRRISPIIPYQIAYKLFNPTVFFSMLNPGQ